MRKYFLIFGLGLACLLTSSVFANGMAYVSHQPCYAIPGWVVGADIGWGYLSTPEDNLMWTDYPHNFALHDLDQSHDIGDIVWGIHAGRTFDITHSMLLGAEVGYKDLGRSKYKSTGIGYGNGEEHWASFDLRRKVSQQAFDALLTSNYFVWRGLNLFAKAGIALVGSKSQQKYWQKDISLMPKNNDEDWQAAYNQTRSIWRFRPEVILGMGYMFNNHIDAHILYDYIYGNSETVWGNNYQDYFFYVSPEPPKPRIYGAHLLIGGISYTF